MFGFRVFAFSRFAAGIPGAEPHISYAQKVGSLQNLKSESIRSGRLFGCVPSGGERLEGVGFGCDDFYFVEVKMPNNIDC